MGEITPASLHFLDGVEDYRLTGELKEAGVVMGLEESRKGLEQAGGRNWGGGGPVGVS